jgi:hypothetical protein
MLTYRLRFYTGPVAVKELGEKFQQAGLRVEFVGTEHVGVLARGDSREDAALGVWHKLHDHYGTTFGLPEPTGDVAHNVEG